MRNRRCEIADAFSKVCSVQEFSRTIFNWALPTIPCRLMMRHAVGAASANRCKRYQLVCGIFRNSSGVFRTRSTITSGKLPSRKRKSAALMASNAFRQRTQSKCRNAELSDEPGSNESEPSINATKWRSRWAALRSAWWKSFRERFPEIDNDRRRRHDQPCHKGEYVQANIYAWRETRRRGPKIKKRR